MRIGFAGISFATSFFVIRQNNSPSCFRAEGEGENLGIAFLSDDRKESESNRT